MPERDPESLFTLREIQRERDIGPDIDLALARCAPQALLRDLHRPITEFKISIWEFERYPLILTDAGAGASRENKHTFQSSYKVPLEELAHTTRDMLAAYRDMKKRVAEPWINAAKLVRPDE